jgi:hypothetical protein
MDMTLLSSVFRDQCSETMKENQQVQDLVLFRIWEQLDFRRHGQDPMLNHVSDGVGLLDPAEADLHAENVTTHCDSREGAIQS